MLGRPEEVDDLAQETFLQAYERLDTLVDGQGVRVLDRDDLRSRRAKAHPARGTPAPPRPPPKRADRRRPARIPASDTRNSHRTHGHLSNSRTVAHGCSTSARPSASGRVDAQRDRVASRDFARHHQTSSPGWRNPPRRSSSPSGGFVSHESNIAAARDDERLDRRDLVSPAVAPPRVDALWGTISAGRPQPRSRKRTYVAVAVAAAACGVAGFLGARPATPTESSVATAPGTRPDEARFELPDGSSVEPGADADLRLTEGAPERGAPGA